MNTIVPWKTVSSVFSVGVNSEGWNLAKVPAEDINLPRTFTTEVVFLEPFNNPPTVHAAIAGFDLDQRDSARVSVAVTLVTNVGFTVAVTSWRETRVYGVEVSWIALGN